MAPQKFVFSDPELEEIAPAEPGLDRRVFDLECRGLGLWIGDNGDKVFFAYRWTMDMPVPHEVAVGAFPELSVEEARQQARSILAQLAREAGGHAGHEDDDALRTAGECRQCKNMTMLNAKGLCAKCRPLPPCVSHPDTQSAARCLGCNKPFCDACLKARHCEACANKNPKRSGNAAAMQAGAKKAIATINKNRKWIIAGATAAFLLVEGGLLLKNYLEDQGPPATAEQVYQQRVGIAEGGVEAFRAENKRLPGDAKELAAFLKKKNGAPVTLVGPGAKDKDAVIYEVKGENYTVVATDADGKPVENPKPNIRRD
jgi:hypothetical protein